MLVKHSLIKTEGNWRYRKLDTAENWKNCRSFITRLAACHLFSSLGESWTPDNHLVSLQITPSDLWYHLMVTP